MTQLTKMVSDNNTSKKKQSRTFELVKKDIITNHSQLRSLISEAINSLRSEGKEKKAVKEQIERELVQPGYLSKSLFYEVIKYEYATEEQKQEIEQEKEAYRIKKKIAYATASGQTVVQEEGEGAGDDDDDEEDDPVKLRERAQQNQLTKNVRKASSAMQKVAPDVINQDLEDDEDDDDDDNDTGLSSEEFADNNDNDDLVPLKEHGNQVVIEDKDHLTEIISLIEQNKAVIVTFNKNMVVEGIKAGKTL